MSQYRPVWMALGIVALYLGIAIGISTWLRPRIGYTWWRRLHVLTIGIYALATLHGIGTGSDTQTWWGLGIYFVSIVLVGSLLWQRLVTSKNKSKHSRPSLPSRRANVTPQSQDLNKSRVAAAPVASQRRYEVARMK